MRYYISLPLIFLLFFSCQRVDDDNAEGFESKGEIIGYNFSLNPCLGGINVKFDDREETFVFSELPLESTLDIPFDSEFPIKIQANWTEGISNSCPLIISIEDIELVE